jgi:hypothetical protein
MVDKISAPNVTNFLQYRARKHPGSENASNNPPSQLDIEQIAQDIFTRMAKAAEALVENNSPENSRRLEKAGNSLLYLGNKGKEISLKDKELILNHLESLSEQSMHAASTLMTHQANVYVSNQLQALKINLEINGWDNSSLQELHQASRNTRQPASVKKLFEILTETIVPESGRIMMYDNLAQLYDHHQNMLMVHDNLAQLYYHYQKMFMMNKKPSPDWDSSIVHMAIFVLDIADEEFRQEKEYDKKELIKAEQPQMPQTEITVNDLRPPPLDRFTQKRLEDTLGKKYNTDSEITLRVDFKENFLSWIKNNLHDFRALSLNGDPLAIFNSLCASAKESQVLRKSLE